MSEHTLEKISSEIGILFQPLLQLNDEQKVTDLFHDLGYTLPVGQDFGNIGGIISKVGDLINAVSALISSSSDEDRWGAVTDVFSKTVEVVSAISSKLDEIKTTLNAIPNFLTNSDIDELPRRLLDYLLVFYLFQHRPKGFGILLFIGLIEEQELPEDVAKFQPAFTLRKVWWERVPMYFSAPQDLPEEIYSWNTQFNHQLFLKNLYAVFHGFNLPGGIYPQSTKMRLALHNTSIDLEELRVPVFEKATWPNMLSQFGINVSPVEQNGTKKPGFAILPYITGTASFDFDINEKLELLFEATASLETGVGIIFRPDTGVEFITNLFNDPLNSVDFQTTLEIRQIENTGEIIIVGAPNASRFAIEGPGLKVFATKSVDGDFGFEIAVSAIKLIISGGDGDGFLAQVLGDGVKVEAGLTLGYSVLNGFYIKGSGGLEIRLPSHISIGPIELQEAILALKFKDGNLVLDAGTTVKLELGPFTAIVENMGLTSTLSFPDKGGNLGPANIAFSFKPPNGIGLSLDTPAVRGGGYLFFDFDNERYGGAIELSISNMFVVSAIGLITTRMPDGTKGFSLLLIISVEFTPGISLSMGFFLSGLGGIIGIHRTLNESALREGVRAGSLDNILFPQNIVANITRIISDIRLIFPPKKDQFMIGLMAKITWGVPTLISIEFGLIIEFDSPVRLAILGIIKIALPTEDEALLLLQVSFAGVINFEEQYLAFDASLFGSRILTFTLEGDMALRLNWGSEKAFLMSVGGFHPSFEPPARLNVGTMKRLTLNILSGNPRLTLTTYFALTSNTVQFGAKIDFYFAISKFKVIGYFGFDVLFQFNPFRFMAAIGAGVEVKIGSTTLLSISLSFDLAGPTPWSASGKASFKILFFKVSVKFSKTWGEKKELSLPAIPVLPELIKAFDQNRNWVAQLPPKRFVLVSLCEVNPEEEGIVLESFGSLSISQSVLPLDLNINKFGNNIPGDISSARVKRITINGQEVETEDVKESFAPASFVEMSDQDKLKSPSYEKEKSGARIKETDQIRVNYGVGRKVTYEVRASDYDRASDQPYELFKPLQLKTLSEHESFFRLGAKGGAAGRSELSRELRRKNKKAKVELASEKFVIAGMDKLIRFDSGGLFTSGTNAEADMALKAILKNDPKLKGKIQVVKEYQLAD